MSKKLLQRYYDVLGEEFDPESVVLKKALRVNTLKISSEDLKKRLEERGVRLEEISFSIPSYNHISTQKNNSHNSKEAIVLTAENKNSDSQRFVLKDAFWYWADFSLASTQEYLLGLFYIQEPASQLVSHILLDHFTASDSLKKEPVRILDMAAAPGSKTTHIAQLTKDNELIIALDSNASRLIALKNNIDRLGIESVMIYRKDSRYADDLEIQFDYVLLDAPCSGNFCVEENFFEKRSLQDIASRVQAQQELLRCAHAVLQQGGTLVYSTCSLEPEEDEIMIDWFIKEYPDMKLEEISCPIGDEGLISFEGKEFSKDLAKTKRFWPHKTGLQGFYIAKLTKQNTW
jgi:tRNA (cytosine40_48-C5)-methyltransferase